MLVIWVTMGEWAVMPQDREPVCLHEKHLKKKNTAVNSFFVNSLFKKSVRDVAFSLWVAVEKDNILTGQQNNFKLLCYIKVYFNCAAATENTYFLTWQLSVKLCIISKESA